MRGVLTVILAGGKGTRLEPLTRDRAKPAVPFGGLYRIIDFTLSNCINSGLRRVLVLTQYKSRSLDRHIRAGWSFLSPELGESIEVLPPQQRIDETGTRAPPTPSTRTSTRSRRENAEHILILAGDHIYKMDYGSMIRAAPAAQRGRDHRLHPGPARRRQALRHHAGRRRRPRHLVPGEAEDGRADARRPAARLGSMGIYVFNTRLMFELLCQDAARPSSDHDFGKNIIPQMIEAGHRVFAYRFRDENRKAVPYWRDVGTLDAYYQANMDLIAVDPVLNLYDASWPIRTFQPQLPPPKFVFSAEGTAGPRPPRRGARQHRLPGLHRLRRARAPQHPVAARARQQLRRGRGLDPVRRRRRRPPLPHPPGDHRQGREAAAVHGHRLRPGVRPPPRASR